MARPKSKETMEKFTMCVPKEDLKRYEENGASIGLTRNSYIRFMTQLGEETYSKMRNK
tara:strand:- start:8042 stop:8215 length:174 start_codon:yes stop_codon:yes gene_type:complete